MRSTKGRGVQAASRTLALGLCLGSVLGCGPGTLAQDASEEDVGALHAGVSSASGTVGGKSVWAHFSNPPAFAGRDYTIITELRRLIDATPAGAAINGTIHSISIDDVADSLLAAQTRGVTVYLALDGKNASSTDPSVVTLKKLAHTKFCTNSSGGGGCIGTSAAGNLHTKMFTFSKTKDPNGVARSNVVWFGSSNLTYSTGPDSFNNTVTVYDEPTLFAGLNANFSDLWNRKHYSGNDYYDSASGRGYYMATGADAYASPEGTSQTDTIVTRLNDVTPDSSCRLRIGMSFVTTGRPELLAQVKRYKAAGCGVWMVVGTAPISVTMRLVEAL